MRIQGEQKESNNDNKIILTKSYIYIYINIITQKMSISKAIVFIFSLLFILFHGKVTTLPEGYVFFYFYFLLCYFYLFI